MTIVKKYYKWIIAILVGIGAFVIFIFTVGRSRVGPLAVDQIKALARRDAKKIEAQAKSDIKEATDEANVDIKERSEALAEKAKLDAAIISDDELMQRCEGSGESKN